MAGTRFTVQAVFSAVDNVTRPVARMQSRFRRSTIRMQRSMQRLNHQANQFGKSVASAGLKLAAGVTASAAGFLLVASNANAATVETDMLAKAVGVSTDLISNLGAAVGAGGFDSGNIVDIIDEMNLKFGESSALELTTPMAEALAGLNMDFDLFKSLDAETQFKTVMDKAMSMSHAEGLSMVDIMMGGEASGVLGILRQRGKSIDEIMKSMNRLNFVTDEGRAGALKYTNAMAGITRATSSLKAEFFGLMGEAIGPFLAQIKEYIAVNKADIHHSMIEGVKAFTAALDYVIKNWDKILDRIKSFGGTAKLILGVVVAFKALLAVITLINVAMLLNPVVRTISLITAGIIALVGIVGYFREDFGAAADWIYDKFKRVLDLIGGVVDKAKILGKAAVMMPAAAIGKAHEKATGLWDQAVSFFGGGDDQGQQEALVSPAARVAKEMRESNTTTTTKSEVTIKDESGRAQVTSGKLGNNLTLIPSGAI